MSADVARKLLEERPAAGGAAGHRRLKLRDKFGAAMHKPEIEEDVDIQEIFRAGPPHPPADGLSPSGQRPAPAFAPRHHPALAIGNAGGIENVGDVPAKGEEPLPGGTVRRGLAAIRRRAGICKQDGVILVGRQQALSARRGSQHQYRIIGGRRPHARRRHDRLGKARRLAKRGAILAADHRSDVMARQRLTRQRCRQSRQHLLIDGQRDGGIAERRMAVGHRHLIMRRQRFQIAKDQHRLGTEQARGKLAKAQRRRPVPVKPVAFRFGRQHG